MSDKTEDPQANVKPLNYREQWQGRAATSHYINPCQAASEASLRCMDRNGYDREKCMDFFAAYRECKSNWIEQKKEDFRQGRPTK